MGRDPHITLETPIPAEWNTPLSLSGTSLPPQGTAPVLPTPPTFSLSTSTNFSNRPSVLRHPLFTPPLDSDQKRPDHFALNFSPYPAIESEEALQTLLLSDPKTSKETMNRWAELVWFCKDRKIPFSEVLKVPNEYQNTMGSLRFLDKQELILQMAAYAAVWELKHRLYAFTPASLQKISEPMRSELTQYGEVMIELIRTWKIGLGTTEHPSGIAAVYDARKDEVLFPKRYPKIGGQEFRYYLYHELDHALHDHNHLSLNGHEEEDRALFVQAYLMLTAEGSTCRSVNLCHTLINASGDFGAKPDEVDYFFGQIDPNQAQRVQHFYDENFLRVSLLLQGDSKGYEQSNERFQILLSQKYGAVRVEKIFRDTQKKKTDDERQERPEKRLAKLNEELRIFLKQPEGDLRQHCFHYQKKLLTTAKERPGLLTQKEDQIYPYVEKLIAYTYALYQMGQIREARTFYHEMVTPLTPLLPMVRQYTYNGISSTPKILR